MKMDGMWCDHYQVKNMAFSNNTPYSIGSNTGSNSYNRQIWVYNPDFLTMSDCKTAMNGVYFYYRNDVSPNVYHFSNLEQLKVWLGENNFWCDISDDITVKYWNRG